MIEKMSLNECNFANSRVFNRVETKNRSQSELTLGGYKELLTKLEVLNQKLNIASTTQESSNEVVFLLCANCGEEHFVGDCAEEQLRGEVKVVTMKSNIISTQIDIEFKISLLEETLT